MKFIITLALTVLITVSVGTMVKIFQNVNFSKFVSPLVAGANISADQTISEATSQSSTLGWQVFVNNYYGYKIKHPSNVNIKNRRNGDISLQKTKVIDILITQNVLASNETVNTIIEKAIDARRNELGDRFSLTNSISPISLGSITAQTYSSFESGENITYYYVPQNTNKYLLIINQTPNQGGTDYLISEDIIYSVELIP